VSASTPQSTPLPFLHALNPDMRLRASIYFVNRGQLCTKGILSCNNWLFPWYVARIDRTCAHDRSANNEAHSRQTTAEAVRRGFPNLALAFSFIILRRVTEVRMTAR